MESRTLWQIVCVVLVAVLSEFAFGVELTFELLDNKRDCFYEEIQKNTTCVLEFQVVTGGSYDVDVTIEAPTKDVIYRQVKAQYDSHKFTAPMSGTYTVCFSNEFSTFSHKLVYMDFQVGEEQPLPGADHVTVMTQLEFVTSEIHKSLTSIIDYQTHHRLREAQGKKRADDLNKRVFYWSLLEFTAILLISLGQVFILKNFFTDKNSAGVSLK